mmetsp:Transcript_17193/g.24200  ORF Transcript_17193/g.24200 Transcript_17193/m.24200 type:complete len:212 (-) Transcript_17193:134-769(-)
MIKKRLCSSRNRNDPAPDAFAPQHGDHDYNQTLKDLYKTAHHNKTAVVNQANQVQENYDQFQLHQGTYYSSTDHKKKTFTATMKGPSILFCGCANMNKSKSGNRHRMYSSGCISETSSDTGGDTSSETPILFETDENEGLLDPYRLSSYNMLARMSGSLKSLKQRTQHVLCQSTAPAPIFTAGKKKKQDQRLRRQFNQRRVEDRAGAFPSL